jgi:hypothetical protein
MHILMGQPSPGAGVRAGYPGHPRLQFITNMAVRLFTLTLLVTTLVFAGCDSGDPINEPRPADVAGSYDIAELRFVPNATNLSPADVGALLNTEISSVLLSSGGNYVLRYQFLGGDEFFVAGNFDVRATTVRFRGSANDRTHYQRLLLDNEFTLNRDPANPALLHAQIERRVNLQEFDRQRYDGLTDVPGRLHIRLIRE